MFKVQTSKGYPNVPWLVIFAMAIALFLLLTSCQSSRSVTAQSQSDTLSLVSMRNRTAFTSATTQSEEAVWFSIDSIVSRPFSWGALLPDSGGRNVPSALDPLSDSGATPTAEPGAARPHFPSAARSTHSAFGPEVVVYGVRFSASSKADNHRQTEVADSLAESRQSASHSKEQVTTKAKPPEWPWLAAFILAAAAAAIYKLRKR